ncbi:MAG TPA: peptide ABC transporter substrate-binding protein, partial [Pseudomonadales bacterium]|nr:peptide ABC transporter substrate-binding protein [Pseudomonadales bacterium]
HVEEGLVRYDRHGRLAPGIAASWEQSDEKIVFHLRRDARWSDGSPVTAADFVFAWRHINDPKTAAPYAAIMYPIANARKIQKGELPVRALGVSAPDDHTLVVRLDAPCGYCLALMAHEAFLPVKQTFFEREGDQYGAEASNLLYNGPFMLTTWQHSARLVMKKNPYYWNRDAVGLNEINVAYITEDNRARFNLFRDGRIALVRLGAETVRDAATQGERIHTFASGGMAFLRFNLHEGHATRNIDLRRAVQLVFDPDEFVDKVIGIPGYRPAYSFFPGWLPGDKTRFLSEYPMAPPTIDPAAARKLIDKARQALGQLPTMTILTVTSPTGTRIAEYFQGLLKQKLGLDVRVDQQTFKQYLAKSRSGDFDLALSSWYPDFNDIVTFADLLASWNPNNRGGYSDTEYDKYCLALMHTADSAARMADADRLQKIIKRDVPILPMAETGSAWLQDPKLVGVVRRQIGPDPDYTYARVVR